MSDGKQEVRGGERAEPIIPRRGMYRACVLPKGHSGEHRGGGNCVAHGPYIGDNCPLDAILLKHGVRGRFQRERIIAELSGQPQGKAQPEGTREAAPSAQFDWYWRSNPSNFEQAKTVDGQMILAWHAWCAALHLNGKAQPDSDCTGDQDCQHSCDAAFQRGQQAMAEKAAQHGTTAWHNVRGYHLRCACGIQFEHPEGQEDEAYEAWQKHIRSLASAEPPQGEAE